MTQVGSYKHGNVQVPDTNWVCFHCCTSQMMSVKNCAMECKEWEPKLAYDQKICILGLQIRILRRFLFFGSAVPIPTLQEI